MFKICVRNSSVILVIFQFASLVVRTLVLLCLFAQSTHLMLRDCELQDTTDQLFLLATLLSAFCHDIDHPGVTNSLLIAAGADVALTYNDVSVLENHHAAVAWSVLRAPSTNVLINVTDANVLRRFRSLFVSSILGTDMSKHAEIIVDVAALPEWTALRYTCELDYMYSSMIEFTLF